MKAIVQDRYGSPDVLDLNRWDGSISTTCRVHTTNAKLAHVMFFAKGRPKAANKLASDTDMTARLWQVSFDLVGFTSR